MPVPFQCTAAWSELLQRRKFSSCLFPTNGSMAAWSLRKGQPSTDASMDRGTWIDGSAARMHGDNGGAPARGLTATLLKLHAIPCSALSIYRWIHGKKNFPSAFRLCKLFSSRRLLSVWSRILVFDGWQGTYAADYGRGSVPCDGNRDAAPVLTRRIERGASDVPRGWAIIYSCVNAMKSGL